MGNQPTAAVRRTFRIFSRFLLAFCIWSLSITASPAPARVQAATSEWAAVANLGVARTGAARRLDLEQPDR